MDDTTTATRRGGGFRGAIAWLAILALLGMVGWLVSERNARTWHLVPDEGRLVVMKGLLLPVGRAAFESADPALAQAYAPLVPPPGKALPPERSFEERTLLDQAVYEVLSGWARDEIAGGEPARLERALGYLSRAEKLPGLSPAQRDDLTALRAESGYHEARRLLDRAVGELRDAADRLRLTSTSRSPRANDAAVLLRQLEPVLGAAVGALQAAGDGTRPAAAQGTPAAQAVPAAAAEKPAAAPDTGR